MAASEFELIRRYFEQTRFPQRPDVILGIGDDGALLEAPPGQTLAVTVDMLVAGVHFPLDADPEAVGHKALAVNLSDLAAMGAVPAWVTLAIALPEPDEPWLQRFSRGFYALAERFQVQLVGGDTTRGPLTISIQAHGFVPASEALRRDGAHPGDIICVTGTLGDAGLALAATQGRMAIPDDRESYLHDRLHRPSPRIPQGIDLRGLASSAIDVSDGLAQDLSHILERSRAGARLYVERLPYSAAFSACCQDIETAIRLAIGSGDDYELCFTVPPKHRERLFALAERWDCRCTEIGVIESEPGLRCRRDDGTTYRFARGGYDHFA